MASHRGKDGRSAESYMMTTWTRTAKAKATARSRFQWRPFMRPGTHHQKLTFFNPSIRIISVNPFNNHNTTINIYLGYIPNNIRITIFRLSYVPDE